MSAAVHSTEVFVPPINFSMLCPGVYRSGYPTKKNFRFLNALRLKSICYLCPEEYSQSNMKFCEENGINVLRFPMEGNKEPFVDIPELSVHRALSALCDAQKPPSADPFTQRETSHRHYMRVSARTRGWSFTSVFDSI